MELSVSYVVDVVYFLLHPIRRLELSVSLFAILRLTCGFGCCPSIIKFPISSSPNAFSSHWWWLPESAIDVIYRIDPCFSLLLNPRMPGMEGPIEALSNSLIWQARSGCSGVGECCPQTHSKGVSRRNYTWTYVSWLKFCILTIFFLVSWLSIEHSHRVFPDLPKILRCSKDQAVV